MQYYELISDNVHKKTILHEKKSENNMTKFFLCFQGKLYLNYWLMAVIKVLSIEVTDVVTKVKVL